MRWGTAVKTTADRSSRFSVLVVDDDSDFRRLIRLYLTDDEFIVSEAEDGSVGLKRLAAGRFDVIVIDMVLPEHDGLELIQSVRHTCPEARILAVSGAREGTLYLKIAGFLGADVIAEKPISRERFLDCLHQLGFSASR